MATLQDFIDSAEDGFEAVAARRNLDRVEWLAKAGTAGEGVVPESFREALELGTGATRDVGTGPDDLVVNSAVSPRALVNVLDRGVVSSSVLNQTALIQAADTYAASEGKMLYFPAGDYVADTLQQTTSWVGDGSKGPHVTRLIASGRTYAHQEWFVHAWEKTGLTLDGILFDFNAPVLPSGTLQANIVSASGNGSIVTLTLDQPFAYPHGSYITVWKTVNPHVTDMGPSSYFGLFSTIEFPASPPGSLKYHHSATGALPVAGRVQINPGNQYAIYAAFMCNDFTISNCRFVGIRDHVLAIAISGCNHFDIFRNHFTNFVTNTGQQTQCLNVSLAHGPSTGVRFHDNYSFGCGVYSDGRNGLYYDNFLEAVKFGSNMAFGPIASGTGNRIYNNTLINGRIMDINYTYVSGVESWNSFTIIKGNVLIGNDGHGLSIASQGNVVTDNIILNNGNLNGDGICHYSAPGSSASDSKSVIANNLSYDARGAGAKQKHGYAEYVIGSAPAISNVYLSNNVLTPNAVGAMNPGRVSEIFSFVGPVLNKKFTGQAVGTLAPSGSWTGTVTFAGARLGDTVSATISPDPQGCIAYGEVLNPNQVTVIVTNPASVSKVVGTVNIAVTLTKPADYNY